MKNLILFFFSLIFIATVTPGCKREQLVDQPVTDQSNALSKARPNQPGPERLLVKDLVGSLGSTIGPSGDLFVPDPAAGSILRINPKTGDYTTFASGLPQEIPGVGLGGITDVAFIGRTAYALVTAVDDPNFFPTGQVNGIYRIDGPNTYTIIADIGAFNIANPTTGFDVEVVTGALYAIQPYRGGFLVSDGHLNRVLHVSLDGEITILRRFNNIVPTGMALKGNQIYLSQAGPVPHLPENGKVVSFSPHSPSVSIVASGAPLVVDVEFGHGQTVFALSQGDYSGDPAGSPALPNTGSLLRVNSNGMFSVLADELDRPTSLEIIGNTAYIITLAGEIWTVDNITGSPNGRGHQKHRLHHHHDRR